MNKYMIMIGILLILFSFAYADTGTYKIDKQNVTLDMQLSGNVNITYDITMSVTGGNIPWVTVGLPNSNYSLLSYSGAAKNAKPNNNYSWSGVYVTLDKTYYSGENFSFQVKVTQNSFISRVSDKNKFQIGFTPLWWDNAIIGTMDITYNLPAGSSNVVTSSQPTTFGKNTIIWTYSNVPNGQHKDSGFTFDSNTMIIAAKASPTGGTNTTAGNTLGTFDFSSLMVFIFVFALIGIFISMLTGGSSRSYSGLGLSVSGDKEITRNINLTCPNDGSRLSKDVVNDVTVDMCPVCGGFFFDNGEIEKLIKKEVNEADLNVNKFTTKESEYKKTPEKCMRCNEDIEKVISTVDGKQYYIYVCGDCSAIWMNKGVYQLIKDKRIEQEAKQKERLDKKKKDEDKDDCLFSVAWWLFYPHIGSTGTGSSAAFGGGGGYSGGGSSGSYSSSSCACVACACVSACACACACAGGGAAGCSPKDKVTSKYPQITSIWNKR